MRLIPNFLRRKPKKNIDPTNYWGMLDSIVVTAAATRREVRMLTADLKETRKELLMTIDKLAQDVQTLIDEALKDISAAMAQAQATDNSSAIDALDIKVNDALGKLKNTFNQTVASNGATIPATPAPTPTPPTPSAPVQGTPPADPSVSTTAPLTPASTVGGASTPSQPNTGTSSDGGASADNAPSGGVHPTLPGGNVIPNV